MYTVVRFSASDTCSDETLTGVGTRLNDLVPRAFERLDRVGRRFSVSVSSKGSWEANIAETLAFLQSARPVIDDAQKMGIAVTASTMIEPEDFHDSIRLTCEMSPELLASFFEAKVALVLTICRTE